MTVHHLIQGAAFEPETTAVMGQAYEEARRRLGANQPTTVLETIARRIIEAARTGERDAGKLTAFALRGLDGHGGSR